MPAGAHAGRRCTWLATRFNAADTRASQQSACESAAHRTGTCRVCGSLLPVNCELKLWGFPTAVDVVHRARLLLFKEDASFMTAKMPLNPVPLRTVVGTRTYAAECLLRTRSMAFGACEERIVRRFGSSDGETNWEPSSSLLGS